MERREFLQWILGAAVLTTGQQAEIERLAKRQPIIDPPKASILPTWHPSVNFRSNLPAEAFDKSICWVEDEMAEYMWADPIGWVKLVMA